MNSTTPEQPSWTYVEVLESIVGYRTRYLIEDEQRLVEDRKTLAAYVEELELARAREVQA